VDDALKDLVQRQYGEYLVQNRTNKISETFADRDARYADVDRLLRGEFGYKLPGDNAIVEDPMVMNLGLTFVNDVSRLVMEQQAVYKSPVFGDDKKDIENAQIREVIDETYWEENDGEVLRAQLAMDIATCGAAYTVCWVDDASPYPQVTRIDPRHAYPTVTNGKLLDLLVVHVYPSHVAELMFPGAGIKEHVSNNEKNIRGEVEIFEYYRAGHASRWVCYQNKNGDPTAALVLDAAEYDPLCMPAHASFLPSPDGGIRGMLDQLGNSLEAKNKIISLMTKYTEHKVFAPWEARGILNPTETPGPNTVYMHDPSYVDGQTFMRRVEPAGSDPALFSLVNIMDLDQRGGIGYPASRQGEVGQSIASAAFVESTQGQLSSIVKNVQMLEADLRGKTLETMSKFDELYLDYRKPLCRAVGDKKTYKPSSDIKGKHVVRVQYGAGAGMSRANADTRVLNLLGARLIDRGTAREQVEFLRDRLDIQDKIEMENAEDSIQQIFWPDPTIPVDIKMRTKKMMAEEGINLTDAWAKLKKVLEAEGQAAEQAMQQAQAGQQGQQPQLPPQEGATPTQATDQALALEKGQVVQEPHDIELPSAPLEQIFVGN
jgi:hypothetical protein